MAGIAAVFLLFLRHADPEPEAKKSDGGSVRLLLAGTSADANAFQRWAELNKPSNIFGYTSAGIFSRSVVVPVREHLPAVRSFQPYEHPYPVPEMPAPGSVAMNHEARLSGHLLAGTLPAAVKGSFPAERIPVFSEAGEVLFGLELPAAKVANPLLIKAEASNLGTRFQIVSTSGDRAFDNQVKELLEEKVQQGTSLAGVLAVWPRNGGEK